MSDTPSNAADPILAYVPREVYGDAAFLNKYRIERGLGRGGFGVVVCARHRELDERVAIKFLRAGPDNRDAIARFRNEARAANRVKDEHVVRIIDVATTETGVPYVVMEYLDGLDLERMLQETHGGQLPVRDVIEFILQACEALAECHAIGIVHRDLKPSNLFCTHGADGLPIIKVLDFGISKLGRAPVDGVMTERHAIIGSPPYMSPEQFHSPAEVDHRTDIWALGVILYELVTGARPFGGDTLFSIWESVKSDSPPSLNHQRKDAPSGLGPVVARCLEKTRERRFQNLADLAKALLPFAPERSRESVRRIVRIVESPGVSTASLSLPPSRPTPLATATTTSVAPRARSRATRFLMGAVVLAAVSVFALRVLRESPPSLHPGGTGAPDAAARKQPVEAPPRPVTARSSTSANGEPAPLRGAPQVIASTHHPGSPLGPPAASAKAARPARRVLLGATPASSGSPAANNGLPGRVGSAGLPGGTASPEGPESPARGRSGKWVVEIVETRKTKPEGSQ